MVKVVIGEKEKYLAEVGEKLNTASGIIKVKKGFVKSHKGKKFLVTEPSIKDLLDKLKRGAQVILPKDMAIIVAYTGLRPWWKVLDTGTGSGFSAIFLANLLPLGKVYSYEKDEKAYRTARENIQKAELKNIVLRKQDVKQLKEKNFDLAVIDLEEVEKVLPIAFKALKPGGWLAVYSPTVDELLKVQKILKKLKIVESSAVEVIVREWQYEKTLRPKTKGIMHTGFISFARKFE